MSLQVSTENKASGMGRAHSHSDGEVEMQNRGWDQLTCS